MMARHRRFAGPRGRVSPASVLTLAPASPRYSAGRGPSWPALLRGSERAHRARGLPCSLRRSLHQSNGWWQPRVSLPLASSTAAQNLATLGCSQAAAVTARRSQTGAIATARRLQRQPAVKPAKLAVAAMMLRLLVIATALLRARGRRGRGWQPPRNGRTRAPDWPPPPRAFQRCAGDLGRGRSACCGPERRGARGCGRWRPARTHRSRPQPARPRRPGSRRQRRGAARCNAPRQCEALCRRARPLVPARCGCGRAAHKVARGVFVSWARRFCQLGRTTVALTAAARCSGVQCATPGSFTFAPAAISSCATR
jgi:hypothetical protein